MLVVVKGAAGWAGLLEGASLLGLGLAGKARVQAVKWVKWLGPEPVPPEKPERVPAWGGRKTLSYIFGNLRKIPKYPKFVTSEKDRNLISILHTGSNWGKQLRRAYRLSGF